MKQPRHMSMAEYRRVLDNRTREHFEKFEKFQDRILKRVKEAFFNEIKKSQLNQKESPIFQLSCWMAISVDLTEHLIPLAKREANKAKAQLKRARARERKANKRKVQ